MTVTALWTPEIAPPDHWLMPAVLYQDRISTFAPEPYLQSADGKEARRLAAKLGDLYEPLHFRDLQGNDLTDLVLSRKDLWIATVERDYRLTGWPRLREWLERIQSWDKRLQDIERHARVLETGLETAKRSLAEAEARQLQSNTTLNGHISQLEAQRLELQSELQERRRQRAERLQPLIERRQALIEVRGKCHTQQVPFLNDAELEAVTAEIREQSANERQGDQTSAEYQRIEMRQKNLRQQLADGAKHLVRLHSDISRCRDALDRHERVSARPWLAEQFRPRWLRAELDEPVPEGLETIAFGKIYGHLFEALAGPGGMWVRRDDNKPYAGTLVGPESVVADVLTILGEYYCAYHPDWVDMTHIGPKALQSNLRQDQSRAFVIQYELPVPKHATLDEAVAFRAQHEEELSLLRQALATELPSDLSLEYINDIRYVIRRLMEDPLSDIRKALSMNRKLGLGSVGKSVAYRVFSGVRDLIAGAGAAALAIPIIGDTLDPRAIAAGAIGGAMIGATKQTTTTAASAYRYARVDRKLESGPFRYMYHLAQDHDLASWPRAGR